jgi:uncharacterized Ntn-hydrolase superfamily protein
MSAALLVVEGRPQDQAGAGTVVDLRVDRSEDPLGELAGLLEAAEAFAGYHLAVGQLFGGDPSAALEAIDRALRTLPGEDNLRFVRAGALLASGATGAAVTELRSLIAGRPSWEVVVRSFAAKGLIAVPEGVSADAVLR